MVKSEWWKSGPRAGYGPTGSAGRRVDPPTFCFHWALAGAALVSLVTGLRIAADQRPGLQGEGAWHWLARLLPQGMVFHWHLLSAAVLMGALAGYGLFLAASGEHRRYRIRRAGRALAGLRTAVIIHWAGLGLLGATLATGVGLYFGALPAAAGALRETHFWLALALPAYITLHLLSHLRLGGPGQLLAMVRIRAGGLAWGLPALAAGALMAVVAGRVDTTFNPTLLIAHATAPPRLDGNAGDPAWATAPAVIVDTHMGLQETAIPVTVRAVHDNERAWWLFSWPDSSRSLAHLPVSKTTTGWQVLHDGFEQDDERTHYEDKLAVMLAARNPWAARTSIHLGSSPLNGAPSPRHGRGYHYTTDGARHDLWHWKAVRSDTLFQADDQSFGPPEPAHALAPRYTAGYRSDPRMSGGYKANWNWFRAHTVTPKRLPLSSRHRFPATTDGVDAGPRGTVMRWSDGFPYTSNTDRIPAGTAIPAVLTTQPMEGDRGHVGARGRWADGRWTVEMSRDLDTGSPFDVAITDDTHLWVSVFDHSQTRHTYHLRPLRLRLERP